MNDRQKMIEELMKHPIGKDQEFHFHCDQCGECCKNRVDILLSPFDLCRMAKALNKPLPEVLQEYGNLYLGNTSKMPLVSLKMREDNGKCPFLMDDTCALQFYSDYGDFESPEQLMRRCKDGDVYYIVAAFDYHF